MRGFIKIKNREQICKKIFILVINAIFVVNTYAVGGDTDTNLGTVTTPDGRTANMVTIEVRDGVALIMMKGEGIIDTSISSEAKIKQFESKPPNYTLPRIKTSVENNYIITENLGNGKVVWKGILFLALFATNDFVQVYDLPGTIVGVEKSFVGEVNIAERILKAGDTWKIGSVTTSEKTLKHESTENECEEVLAKAEILSLQGSNEEAYEVFEKSLNLATDAETKARATVGMAHVLDGDGRSKEAQDLYLKAAGLTTSPNTKAMIMIGQTTPLLQQRKFSEARTMVEQALSLATEPQTKALALMTASGFDIIEGNVESGRKRFIAAGDMIQAAITAVEDNEKKAYLKMVLSIIFMAQNRWSDVDDTIEEAFNLTENPEIKCDILLFQGGIYSSRKEFNRARYCFEQGLKLSPTSDHIAKCFTGLGEVAEYEGNTFKALFNYDKALAKANCKETRSLALFKKGTVIFGQGKYKEALLYFEEVIPLTHSVHRKARSLANIGLILAQMGKIDEAQTKFEEALSFPLRPSVKNEIEKLLKEYENMN